MSAVLLRPLRLLCAIATFAYGSLFMQTVTADEPETVRNRSAQQVEQLALQAIAAQQRFTELSVREHRRKLYFDVTIAPNTDRKEWRVLINQASPDFAQADNTYKAEGFELISSAEVRANGRTYVSGVWWQTDIPEKALQLPEGPLPASGTQDAEVRPLTEYLQDFCRRNNAAGVTMAVSRDGEIRYEQAVGWADVSVARPMNPDTPMRIASISKPIAATAVMLLVQDGVLEPDQPVLPLLQKLRLKNARQPEDPRWREITIRHLLQHTAGFDRDATQDPMFQVPQATRALRLRHTARDRDLITWMLDRKLDFDPGARYAYSNFGYCLLGRAVEAADPQGRSFGDFVRDRILTPAGMTSTYLAKTRPADRPFNEARYHMQKESRAMAFWNDRSNENGQFQTVRRPDGAWDLEVMDANGGWVSTAGDLLRFVAALEDPETPLLSSELRDAMFDRPVIGGSQDPSANFWYGFGWQVRRSGGGINFWHTGALDGTSTLLVRRHDGFSWAALFNTDRSPDGDRLASLIDGPLHSVVNQVQW